MLIHVKSRMVSPKSSVNDVFRALSFVILFADKFSSFLFVDKFRHSCLLTMEFKQVMWQSLTFDNWTWTALSICSQTFRSVGRCTLSHYHVFFPSSRQ